MQFETAAQQWAYEMISSWMGELFGDQVQPLTHGPGFVVYVGSTAATITVTPYGDGDALIESAAMVVREACVGEPLMRFLLNENHNRLFGTFSLDAQDRIFMQHTVIASTCQRRELEASVLAVVQAADYYDDIIVLTYGGYRGLDMSPNEWETTPSGQGEAPIDALPAVVPNGDVAATGSIDAALAEVPNGDVAATGSIGGAPAEVPDGDAAATGSLGAAPAEVPNGDVAATGSTGAVPAEVPNGDVAATGSTGAVPAEASPPNPWEAT